MPILSREEREAANKASAEKNLKLRETRSNARREKNEIRERLQGVNNTSDRRSIKSGAIYDLSTNSYVEKKEFPQTGKRSIQDNAVDFVDRDRIEGEGGSDGNVEFNGSVLICINGDPYYIDIPYDSETGPYASSSGANFPITAP
jgi:hypothetical protein